MTTTTQLKREDLWSLEQYSEKRADFRQQVLAHKKNRNVMLGDHVLLMFEDLQTIHYQIQEMLRIEKVFESAGIQDELDAYNPLIPDGENWKCTMLIQYQDVEERKAKLQELKDIESLIWVQAEGCDKIFAIADEDMDRANDDKTSAVHFMRFQFDPESLSAAKGGANVSIGCDHIAYSKQLVLSPNVLQSLIGDFA
mgnify:CR=1 FL=1|tara:strand:- start:6764 stop:7354 length:591 start_codon:yes stop_codon:yes gene_type:complete